jgi:hypothetical protein
MRNGGSAARFREYRTGGRAKPASPEPEFRDRPSFLPSAVLGTREFQTACAKQKAPATEFRAARAGQKAPTTELRASRAEQKAPATELRASRAEQKARMTRRRTPCPEQKAWKTGFELQAPVKKARRRLFRPKNPAIKRTGRRTANGALGRIPRKPLIYNSFDFRRPSSEPERTMTSVG